jgi:tRNA-dihydrouridine synthase B
MKKKLIVGNIELDNNIILAPMVGITNLPLRLLAKNGGAGLVYTEMISAKALIHSHKKTNKLFKILDRERPIAAQIFGSDIYDMSEASKIISSIGFDIIDINLGCPVKKIVRIGAGAKLLTDKKLVSGILESVVKSVSIPVTIKIRIGLLPGQNVAHEIIKIAEDCGIKMVVIHARSASQGHSGIPDLQLFINSCAYAKIPIIANGGIIDEKTAANFLQVPNCAGVMIGRGAIANYSIFKRLKKFFDTGEKLTLPSKMKKIKWLEQHVKYSIEYYGENKGLIMMRKVAHYYFKNLPNAARIRSVFNRITTLADFNEFVKVISDNKNNKCN